MAKGSFDKEIKSSIADKGKDEKKPPPGKFQAKQADVQQAKEPLPQGVPHGAAPPRGAAMPMPQPMPQPGPPVSQSDPMLHAAAIAHAILNHGAQRGM